MPCSVGASSSSWLWNGLAALRRGSCPHRDLFLGTWEERAPQRPKAPCSLGVDAKKGVKPGLLLLREVLGCCTGSGQWCHCHQLC